MFTVPSLLPIWYGDFLPLGLGIQQTDKKLKIGSKTICER